WALLAAFGLTLAALPISAQQHPPQALEQARLGVSLAQNGRDTEAIRAYQRAIAIDPTLPGIDLNLGLAYFKSGKFREALPSFEKENANAPSDRVTILLGMSQFGLGQYREAAARLKPLVEAQPDNTELSYLLAKCYLWSGQTKEAMDLFERL